MSSLSYLSVTSPTSQLILQPFRRFTYVTAHSPTLPLLHLRYSSFSNPSVASPTSQALQLIHQASRQCCRPRFAKWRDLCCRNTVGLGILMQLQYSAEICHHRSPSYSVIDFSLLNILHDQQKNFPMVRQTHSQYVLESCEELNFLKHDFVCLRFMQFTSGSPCFNNRLLFWKVYRRKS